MPQSDHLWNANLVRLVLCQLISVSGTVLVITAGGIVGKALASSPSLATLPMSVMVVGTAIGTVPAALIMQRLGRRAGFSVGIGVAALGVLGILLGLNLESFWLFCGSTALIGLSLAASQQYRFAAAETVSGSLVSRAVSAVLIGSIGGAIVGPELAKLAGDGGVHSFERPFWFALVLYGIALLILLGYRAASPVAVEEADAATEVRWGALLRRPLVLAAVGGGVVGQGVMTLIMTATPISMHVMHGFSMADTADVIRNHVLAMYIPSLFSGWLIDRFGVGKVLYAGVVIMLATVGVGLMGHEYMHYSASMIALGIAWNFLFVGGTTLLVRAQTETERFRMQAMNDFCVFGGSALASLAAGVLLHVVGWVGLLLSGVPIVLVFLMLLLRVHRDPRVA